MYLDRKAILDSLIKDDVIKIVMNIGSAEPKYGTNGDLLFETIYHNVPQNNNSYKLYYYHEPSGEFKGRLFHCYTGCSESFGIIELL